MTTQLDRPNIILILADDMGFSDIGCYGSEINTPNIDSLARDGLRFSQMYNAAVCSPTRAALLTGLNPHQAGMGDMAEATHVDLPGDPPAYAGYLNRNCVTVAEVLKRRGYRTLMSGKWHVGGHFNPARRETWSLGDEQHPTPRQRGFDRFFGTLLGVGSYYSPTTLMQGDALIPIGDPDFYYTDAISDNAVTMINESIDDGAPFFAYVAYTAPHTPLHALEEDIARYQGRYMAGWDRLRDQRHEVLKANGILSEAWTMSPRDPEAPAWEDEENKEWQDRCMAVYAAMIDQMDQGIGRILATLKERGQEENTVVMFLSDNGAAAGWIPEDNVTGDPRQYYMRTRDGRPVRVGNSPSIMPGPEDTWSCYDMPWANACNTPFRLYKNWTHEGGVATPLVVRWPERVKPGSIVHEPAYVTDIMATCLDVAGAQYPSTFDGHSITPLEGESFAPLLGGQPWSREKPIIWERRDCRAVRIGDWKLVAERGKGWELYNLVDDRTELTDLVQRERDRVDDMQRMWQEWASRCGVISWPLPEGEKRTRYQGVSFWPSRAYSQPANFLSRRGQ